MEDPKKESNLIEFKPENVAPSVDVDSLPLLLKVSVDRWILWMLDWC